MIAKVVFRKRYYVKEGIEQGLLKQNLVPIQLLKQIKQRFDLFSYQHYTDYVTKRLLNEIKEENQEKKVKMKINLTLHLLGVIRIFGINIKRVSL